MDISKREKKQSNVFLSGVLILSLSTVIVKIIGLIYKIPMLRLLGSEGMGYFNSAYEIYTLFCTVATTGLPVAMSVIISSMNDPDREANGVLRAAMRLFLCLGAVGGGIMLVFSRPFAAFLGNESAAYCILAISPTVLLICISSAYRGYFQGRGRMTPTALSQAIEALGKLILGLILAAVALEAGKSTEKVAAFAVLGLVLGTAASTFYLFVAKGRGKAEPLVTVDRKSEGEMRKKLLRVAIPVTLSSVVISVTKVIDMSTILRRLQALGASSEAAFAAYGNYTTLALPLFSLAPALISSVALPLIPSLSRAASSGDVKEQSRVLGDALRLTALVSMPISLGLTLFSEPILNLIFAGEGEAIAYTAPLLSLLGPSVVLSCLITVGNAALQAYGRSGVPVISTVIGSLAKIIIAYLLIGDPRVGILGAPISTFICDLLINVVNIFCLCRVLPEFPSVDKILLRPFLSAAISVSLARLGYNALVVRFGESAILTVSAITLAAVVYAITAVMLRAVDRDDILSLPFVRKGRIENEKKEI